ncbi:hypothetical protein CNYM01_11248 [Colletotrichum nymphaeae SA-01]|uniref:MADS-box domain-containing protein n=1 Tax=Colletotrichum nymphaeae SA-01 TaxID=1460502 RepID=A0A135RY46_9PEZI|nr:hypothetical protein CNYM01_11248 [Colletotrichum nymphaeae SA-01]
MAQNPARCFKTRKDGLVNKAHVLHNLLPDAKVAMFALYDGNIYSYQSHENWPLNPFEMKGGTALPDDQKLPGHFVTIKFTKDSRQGSDSGSSTTTKSENSDESVTTGLERHQTYVPQSGIMNTTGCETPPGSRATTPSSSSFKLAPTASSTPSTPTPSILPMVNMNPHSSTDPQGAPSLQSAMTVKSSTEKGSAAASGGPQIMRTDLNCRESPKPSRQSATLNMRGSPRTSTPTLSGGVRKTVKSRAMCEIPEYFKFRVGKNMSE